MSYPASDHCDGAHFFNPEGSRRNSRRFALLRWMTQRGGRAKWPIHVENTAYAPPGEAVAAGDVALTFIGHSSFLLRMDGLTLLTDPMFSARCSPVGWAGPKRVRAPGQPIAALPKPDAILLSHNHYDHCDLPSLQALQSRFGRIPIIAPLGNRIWLARHGVHPVIELDWWQRTRIDDATIVLTPARHFAARTLRDRNTTLWGGFFVRHGGASVYFAGDTGYTGYFRTISERLGAPDIALLPIGAYEPRWIMGNVHMNPADAVRAFGELSTGCAVGMHFGTFQLTDEAIDAPLVDLAAACDATGIDSTRFVTLDFGETRMFRRGRTEA
ncbi:MAG: MBL fold metallo-hydrolase [Acidiphilium sp.]|nr:MBL fold metallo-hydrolase [Acidiphilium sp.]MDD4935668.1 MBL fold metallo-hydrolase [Acidiphilium sp.]